MHKQIKQIAGWFSRSGVLLFVLISSLLLLGTVIFRFVTQNNWLASEFNTQIQNSQLNEEIAKLNLYIKNAESADHGYAISGSPEFARNFDASIDSILTIYREIQQLENRNTDHADAALFLRSDSLVQQNIAFMKQVKSLCDNHQYKVAADLIATSEGLHLSDSIAGINKQISKNIHARLQQSQSSFLKVKSNNNSIAYTGISISILLIVFSFSLLMLEIRKIKKISKELFERKEKYRVTLNSLSEGMISTDKEGNIQYMNPVAEKLTGWGWKEAKKQPLSNVFVVVNQENGQPFEDVVSRILKQGKPIGLENHTLLNSKDSGTYIISNNGSPIFDINGDISGAVLVFNDITEKHKTAKQLRDSEEKYRSLIEQASDAILVYSLDGTIYEFNKSCYTMLGYSKEEFAKLKLTDLLVDDIVINQDNYAAILAGEIKTLYRKIMQKDGSIIEIEITVKMLVDGKTIAFGRDITERKKAEAAIVVSEKEFRLLAESMPQIVWATRADGWNIYFNQQWVDYTGLTMEESYGHGWNKPFHPDDQQRAWDAWENAVQNLAEYVLECRLRRHDGTYHWWLIKGVPQIGENGKILKWYGTCTDIEKIKQTEQELKQNEEKFRSLFEQAAEGIFLFDQRANILSVNSSGCRMVGYDKKELLGMTLLDLMPPEFAGKMPIDLSKVNEISPLLFERQVRRKEGSIFITEVSVKLLADGNIQVIVRDITERKQAEEIIRKEKDLSDKIINSLPGVFCFYDENLELIRWNKQFENVSGYTAAEIRFKNLLEFFQGQDKPYMQERSRKVFASGSGDAEANFTSKTGKKTPFYFTGMRIQYENRPCLLSIGIDITERKKAERELLNSNIRLENAEELANIGSWKRNMVSNKRYWSKNMFRLFGLEPADNPPSFKDYLDCIHPEDREKIEERLGKIDQGLELPNFEYRTNPEKGPVRNLYATLQYEKDAESKIIKYSGTLLDITKHNKAEAAIKKEKELSDSVINSLPGIFYLYDKNLKLLRWNKQFENVTGYSAAELSAMNPLEFFEGEDRIYMQQRIRKVFAYGIGDAEAKLTTKSGKKIPFYFTGHRMQYEGNLTLLGIGIDITERKIAEKEIRDYKLALDESSLVDVSDSNGIIRYANEKFCRISKYSLNELTGQDHRILNSGFHSKDLFHNLWDTVNTGKIWRNEVRNRAKDGSFFWVDTTIVPFLDHNGKPFQFITIRTDITKRKNAEARIAEVVERYEILAHATSDTIWDWDIVNNTMLYNEGITNMFGYKISEVENVVDWWNNKLHSEDFQNVTDVLEDIFEKKTERLQMSYRFRCADGAYKYIFDRAFVIFDNDDKPIRMIGAMQDITYQTEEEIKISKAIIDAQEGERRFIGAELHDNINQILGGTLLTLGMAKSKEVNASQKTKFINSAMEYITDAINEARKLSHSLVPASFEDNSLKDLFENLLFSINLDGQIITSLHFDEFNEADLPENIQINLYRILQEQTKNILKYSGASTVEIEVKKINNAVSLRIFDNGIGFDIKAKKSGIGLSNIKKRAESLSGIYILNSAPGKGCEIIITIPLTQVLDQRA